MTIIHELTQVIAKYDLLQHPFYQAWSKGTLSQAVLQDYAVQYYHQVKSFPCFISRVHTGCPEIQVRKELLKNLVEEEIQGVDHPALWMQFAEGIGVDRETVANALPYPETQHMVQQYFHLAERDWRDGLCALFAYEAQVPAIAASKIAGLKQHYGINDEDTLEFFTAHEKYDVKHAAQVAALIAEYVDVEKAALATQEAARALYLFLDGMCKKHQLENNCVLN